ncbi:PaaX family transcriptional regulator C-terminal domain-containing protein [soil metagenome]
MLASYTEAVSTVTTGAHPLTARSVLLSLLLGSTPPRSPVAQLVRTAGMFGIAEGTTRTALSRMSGAGEVTASDGWYEITSERLLARQRRQLESRSATTVIWEPPSWRGAVIVTDGRRAATDRARLRDELTRARLAELREGVWLRPDNLPPTSIDAPEVQWFKIEPASDPVALAADLWGLAGWSAGAADLLGAMDALLAPLDRRDHRALADGFVTSAAVLRHFQADPLLPPELLPNSWPGHNLRARYDRYDAAYRACLAEFFRADS